VKKQDCVRRIFAEQAFPLNLLNPPTDFCNRIELIRRICFSFQILKMIPPLLNMLIKGRAEAT
jgi:hypothetical protein